MKLFEVFLTPGRDAAGILSKDTLDDTGAQVFSPAEARLVGLQDIPEDPEGRARVFIACGPADEGYIQSRLEAHDAVAAFKLHDIG